MLTTAVVIVGTVACGVLTGRGLGATTKPDTKRAVPWSLMVTVFEEKDKKTTTFLATVVNVSDKEQILFTPGLVGPNFFNINRVEARLETFVPPRRGKARQYDFVRLKPGQGFTRTFVYGGVLSDFTSTTLLRVGVKLFIYEPGKEGHSRHVSRVIQGPSVNINVRREHPTTKSASD